MDKLFFSQKPSSRIMICTRGSKLSAENKQLLSYTMLIPSTIKTFSNQNLKTKKNSQKTENFCGL